MEISAGKEHTLVLTSSNEVWGFGNGQHGQCGFGDNCDTPIPKLLTFPRSEIYVRGLHSRCQMRSLITQTRMNCLRLLDSQEAVDTL